MSLQDSLVWVGPQITVSVGDGITAEQIHLMLRRMYCGGINCYGWSPDQLSFGEGSIKFVRCFRNGFRDSLNRPQASEVMKYMQNTTEPMTYEIGLRWFLIAPGMHVRSNGGLPTYVLPKDPIVKNGKPHALVFRRGSETPVICFEAIDPEQAFPHGDFLSALWLDLD